MKLPNLPLFVVLLWTMALSVSRAKGNLFKDFVSKGEELYEQIKFAIKVRRHFAYFAQLHAQELKYTGFKEYNCETGTGKGNSTLLPSLPPPESVHQLRPADIKVVATLGDSLSAANGARARSIFELIIEYRGRAFTGGCDFDYTKHITIPNMLRYYNPELKGCSTGKCWPYHQTCANLNVAVPGEFSDTLIQQIETLEGRMKSSLTAESFQNDWKLVTVFIGGNDLCNSCVYKEKYSAKSYAENVRKVVAELRDTIPNIIVNVIAPPNVEIPHNVKSDVCKFLHKWVAHALK